MRASLTRAEAAPPRPAAPLPTGPVASRLVTIEAMALLLVARALIAWVPFVRWRALLGTRVAPAEGRAGTGGVSRAAPDSLGRYLAKAVDRAAGRLPLELRCLPRAAALHWMLRRRNRYGQLVIAALPQEFRRGRDDLHAWVEAGGKVLIGQGDDQHLPLLRLAFAATIGDEC